MKILRNAAALFALLFVGSIGFMVAAIVWIMLFECLVRKATEYSFGGFQ